MFFSRERSLWAVQMSNCFLSHWKWECLFESVNTEKWAILVGTITENSVVIHGV